MYLSQGRPDLAAPHLRRALAVWEATLGADSPQAHNTREALRQVERSTPPRDR